MYAGLGYYTVYFLLILFYFVKVAFHFIYGAALLYQICSVCVFIWFISRVHTWFSINELLSYLTY